MCWGPTVGASAGVGLVAQAGQVLRDPVGRRGRLRAESHRLFEQGRRRPVGDEDPRDLGLQPELSRTGLRRARGSSGKDARISSIHASSGSNAGMSGSGK